MPLNPLDFDNNYFKDIYDRGDPMRALDFDKQFTTLSNYVNKQILPSLNDLSVGSLPGSNNPANVSKFFRNVGDGTTEFAKLTNASFIDYSLSWNRLKSASPGSVLVSAADQTFTSVTPTEKNQVLVSATDNSPSWQFISGDNINNRSIDGSKVALSSIPASKIFPGTLGTQLTPLVVTANKIKDRAATTPKFLDEAFTSDVLGNDLTDKFLNTISTERIPDNYISNFILNNYNFLGFENFLEGLNVQAFNTLIKIPTIKFDYSNGYNIVNNPILEPKLITAEKIQHSSISGDRIKYTSSVNIQRPYPNDIIANGAITPVFLKVEWRNILGL